MLLYPDAGPLAQLGDIIASMVRIAGEEYNAGGTTKRLDESIKAILKAAGIIGPISCSGCWKFYDGHLHAGWSWGGQPFGSLRMRWNKIDPPEFKLQPRKVFT